MKPVKFDRRSGSWHGWRQQGSPMLRLPSDSSAGTLTNGTSVEAVTLRNACGRFRAHHCLWRDAAIADRA